MCFDCIKRIASVSVCVVVADVGKQRVRTPAKSRQICSLGHVAVVVNPLLFDETRIDVERCGNHIAWLPRGKWRGAATLRGVRRHVDLCLLEQEVLRGRQQLAVAT